LRLALGDELTDGFKEEVAMKTRGAAGAIIVAKGCTSYGIGNVAASICRHILFDSRTVRPLSFFQPELGCCLSMPAVLGRRGILKAMPIELDASEKQELETCARGLRAVIEGAEKELSADKELKKALEMDKGT
jgi:L-lactate dehydrogenase